MSLIAPLTSTPSSLSLAATVYGWWAKQPRALRNLSVIGRVIPIAMALISIILLQLEFTHDNFTAYLVIANAQCMCQFASPPPPTRPNTALHHLADTP